MWRTRDDEGSVALEFGLLLPVLLLILFGIIQFGLTLHRTQALQAAGHEGARLAALPSSSVGEIVDRLQGSLSPIAAIEDWTSCAISQDQLCWHVSDQDDNVYTDLDLAPCSAAGVDNVTVVVQQPHTITLPLFPALGPYTLTGIGEFRCER
jgi:hypothetical protein